MKTISVVAQKGGSGKTTVSVSIAVAAARAGLSSAVVDLDPQATAANWSDRRESATPVVISAQASRLPKILEGAEAGGADLVVIDTAPRAEQAALAAARAADLVLVPCRPAVYDLETIATTVDLVGLAGGKPVLVVLNGVPSRGPKADQARDVLESLGVPVCPAAFGHRVAFDHAGAVGLSAQEHQPGGKAAAEIAEVYVSVMQRVNLSTGKGGV